MRGKLKLRKDLKIINIHMLTDLDQETIRRGYGKFKERYEYLLRNYTNDKEELERLWKDIKKIQTDRRDYIQIDFQVSFTNNIRKMIEFHNRYARKLLISFYPNRGPEFVENELREYRESGDKLELFDAYFMLFQYTIVNSEMVRLLDKFTFK